ncbi:hypothetical protein BDN72DRAFT_844193 [Pluteus cervinus]|uniref:Uncharacterized protein n=1 Tax=Pluteus cervinus TaxID=181527 RepID=A0ACD3AM59_9AGAR|nr:hypothetical protein BDN72DRAFT_844193 [Pluteus cervinus]
MSSTQNKKRKSDAGTSVTASKKARTASQTPAEFVDEILGSPDTFSVPIGEDATRKVLVDVAQYVQILQSQIDSLKPKARSPEDIEDAAQKIRAVAKSAILNHMSWRPTCNDGRAKWTYDGVCQDPEIFGAVIGLTGAPLPFKTKKIPQAEFEKLFGGTFHKSIRYATLELTSDVTVQWFPEEGTFKLKGLYGK